MNHGPIVVEATCRGSARAMGIAQGDAVRSKIHGAIAALAELEAFQLQKPWWLPFGLFRRVAERKAGGFVRQGLADDRAPFAERLAGLAEGSGTGFRQLALLNVLEGVLSDLSDTTCLPVEAACSAVALRGAASQTGEPIVAHNFDYLPLVQPFYIVRRSEPTDGLRSLEFTVAPLCGTVDGINEAGLAVVYNYAYSVDAAPPAPTLSMVLSDVLARCRTVDEAVAFLGSARRWGGGILMLADADGRIASLEISKTESRARSPGDAHEFLCHTNRYRTASMRCVELAGAATYTDHAPRALRGRRVHQSADQRDARFAQRLTGKALSPDDLAALMSDHGPDDTPSADTICMHSDYWHTTACVQLFPASRRMRISYSTACAAEYTELEL